MAETVLITGGGFAGCATAHQPAPQGGWDVTLVENQPVLGAGVRTNRYGVDSTTIGLRHFLTPWQEVFEYLPMRKLDHEFLTHGELPLVARNGSNLYEVDIKDCIKQSMDVAAALA